LKKTSLAFHSQLAGQHADVPETQDGSAFGHNCDQVPFRGITVSHNESLQKLKQTKRPKSTDSFPR
jgi:hypothetical protein